MHQELEQFVRESEAFAVDHRYLMTDDVDTELLRLRG